MSALRSRVLASFRSLHEARKQVFAGDTEMLTAGRNKINEEFKKNKNLAEVEEIEEMVKLAEDSAVTLRTMVVQAEYNEDKDVYQLKITKDTALQSNAPFVGEDSTQSRPSH
ncbi:hypothetical protein NP493_866g00038 [Ridgeia piscesae]|uniref:Complex III assembly factor LYRM7 n=1 Tax=Ridgeia piscesae TaxID=27915 RepID=A0AAD9KLM6_RIDPI|nr:hypothetical protein NP493_866g00038 [Ridgeia piscesae]